MSCSVYFMFLLPILPFQIQSISISYPIHIHFRSNSNPLHICLSCFVYFQFLIPVQTLSNTYYIDSLSNTYPIYIHFRSNSYPLHILLYQNKLLYVFSVFTPHPDFIIHILSKPQPNFNAT